MFGGGNGRLSSFRVSLQLFWRWTIFVVGFLLLCIDNEIDKGWWVFLILIRVVMEVNFVKFQQLYFINLRILWLSL